MDGHHIVFIDVICTTIIVQNYINNRLPYLIYMYAILPILNAFVVGLMHLSFQNKCFITYAINIQIILRPMSHHFVKFLCLMMQFIIDNVAFHLQFMTD